MILTRETDPCDIGVQKSIHGELIEDSRNSLLCQMNYVFSLFSFAIILLGGIFNSPKFSSNEFKGMTLFICLEVFLNFRNINPTVTYIIMFTRIISVGLLRTDLPFPYYELLVILCRAPVFFQSISRRLFTLFFIAGMILMGIIGLIRNDEATDVLNVPSCVIWMGICFSLMCFADASLYVLYHKRDLALISDLERKSSQARDQRRRFILLLSHTAKNVSSGINPALDRVKEIVNETNIHIKKFRKLQLFLDSCSVWTNHTFRMIFNLINFRGVHQGKDVVQDSSSLRSPSSGLRFDLHSMIRYLETDLKRHIYLVSQRRIEIERASVSFPRYCVGDAMLIKQMIENMIWGIIEKGTSNKLVFSIAYDKITSNLSITLKQQKTRETEATKKIPKEDIVIPIEQQSILSVTETVLSQQLGGTLEFWDKPGIGMGASFSIPLPSSKYDPSFKIERDRVSGLKVLFIEDNVICRRFMRKFVDKCARDDGNAEYEVLEYENGQEAYDALTSGRFLPDLIISDYDMPVMNGHEFSSSYAEFQRTCTTPALKKKDWCDIYLCTGASFSKAKQAEFRENGLFKEVLSKPIVFPIVRSLLDRTLEKKWREVRAQEEEEIEEEEEEEEEEIEEEGEQQQQQQQQQQLVEILGKEDVQKEQQQRRPRLPLARVFAWEYYSSLKRKWDKFWLQLIISLSFALFVCGFRYISLVIMVSTFSLVIPLDVVTSILYEDEAVSEVLSLFIARALFTCVVSVHFRIFMHFSIIQTIALENRSSQRFYSILFLLICLFFEVVLLPLVKDHTIFSLESPYIRTIVEILMAFFTKHHIPEAGSALQKTKKKSKERCKRVVDDEKKLLSSIHWASLRVRTPFFLALHYSRLLYDELLMQMGETNLSRSDMETFEDMFRSLAMFKKDNLNLLVSRDLYYLKKTFTKKWVTTIYLLDTLQDITEQQKEYFNVKYINQQHKRRVSGKGYSGVREEEEKVMKSNMDNVEFIVDLHEGSLKREARVNPQCLEIITTNLIQNAAENTKSGYIYVKARVRKGELIFSVKDTGRGMKPEELEYYNSIGKVMVEDSILNERNVKHGEETGNPKLGLGLLCSRRLISECLNDGGSITLESPTGGGTKSVFRCHIGENKYDRYLSPRKRSRKNRELRIFMLFDNWIFGSTSKQVSLLLGCYADNVQLIYYNQKKSSFFSDDLSLHTKTEDEKFERTFRKARKCVVDQEGCFDICIFGRDREDPGITHFLEELKRRDGYDLLENSFCAFGTSDFCKNGVALEKGGKVINKEGRYQRFSHFQFSQPLRLFDMERLLDFFYIQEFE